MKYFPVLLCTARLCIIMCTGPCPDAGEGNIIDDDVSPSCRLVSHPLQPLHTEKSVQDPELQALLATSLKKKKPSKKKQAKEAEKATPMEQ